MLGWALLACLVTLSNGITIGASTFDVTRIGGKSPDTCTNGNGVSSATPAQADCIPTTPDASRTLIVPSESTPNLATLANGAISAATFSVQIQGDVPQNLAICLGGYDRQRDVALPCGSGCDAAFVVQPVSAQTGGANTATFTLPTGGGATAWNTVALEVENNARKLCFVDGGGNAVWTGANLGVVFSCTTVQDCNRDLNLPATQTNFPAYAALSETERIQIMFRNSSCCRTDTNFLNGGLQVGTCVNANVQTCCGATPVFPGTSKCCNAEREWVAFQDSFCPCEPAASRDAANAQCPTAEPTCCVATKYPDFATLNPVTGRCYNNSRHSCCDTGHVYDPGSHQCCAINGLQSLNVPCPCETDLDCYSGTANLTLDRMACCKQTAPLPYQDPQCTTFSNFPVGTGPYMAQRCTGVCIDTDYQICCNGAVCREEYERCCNSTCCNRFTGACKEGIRPATVNNAYNWVEFGQKYLQCSEIEHLSTLRAFWVYILPVALLIMTLLALGLMLVFANKASTRSYSFIEAAMIAVGALAIIFAIPLFFSPFYKYGVFTVLIGLIAIAAAAVRAPVFNILAVIALLVLLLFLVDPFAGNDYLNFSYLRTYFGEPNPESAGIFNSIGSLYRNDTSVRDVRYCTEWYDYFRLDNQLRDTTRYHNPYVTTFGYCSRAWITALLIFAAILLLLALLLFFLAIMGLLMRFRSQRFEPVELEVRGTDAPQGLMGAGPGLVGLDDDLLD